HRQFGDVVAVERDRTGVGGDQPGDDVEARRLAGAVRAKQSDHFATLYRDMDVAQHRSPLEAFAEAAADQAAIIGNKSRPEPGQRRFVFFGMSVRRSHQGDFAGGAVAGAGPLPVVPRALFASSRTNSPWTRCGGAPGAPPLGRIRLTLLFMSMTADCPRI